MGAPLYVDTARPTVEVYGPLAGTGLWGDPTTTWGTPGDVWGDAATASAWRSVACQVQAFKSSWGADEGQGVLAQSAAGVLTLTTYDPDRLLDPSNGASPLWRLTRIGTPYRLVLPPTGMVIGYGYLDEIEFRYEEKQGTVTAADEIAKLAQADTAADFWQPSNGLVAFATAAIASAGQSVPVGAAPAAGDPVIAYTDSRGKAVWAVIRDAAQDALCLAWIDRQTSPPTLRFAPFGFPTDLGLRLGDGGIPLAQLQAIGSGSGVVNVVDDGTGELARRPTATGRDQALEVSRIEPAGVNWANAILADRGLATVTLVPGEILPSSMGELVQILQARAMDLCRIVLTAQPLDVSLRIVGGLLEGEAGGIYRAKLAVYGPGSPWAYLPPPPASTAATPSTRVVTASKDSGIWTSGTSQPGTNRNKGNGLGPIRVGRDIPTIGTFAALLAFDGLDLTGVRRIRKIELVTVWDRAQANPVDVEINRIAATWDEGRVKSTDTPTAQNGNSVVWPGPAVDAAKVSATLVAAAAGATQRVDITSIAMVTMPIALGGRGYPSFGYRVIGIPNPPSGSYSGYLAATETDDDEPSATGCRLELTVEV